MALIIERINKAGHVLARDKFECDVINIGRGLDQAIIIDDEYVDASHLQLIYDKSNQTIACTDLASCNGISVEPLIGIKKRLLGHAKLNSGDVLVIGRTRLRVLLSEAQVPPAQKLTFWHDCIYRLSIWPTVVFCALLLTALITMEAYLNLPNVDFVEKYISQGLYTLLVAFVYAGIWALIARALSGEGRLITQLLFVLLVLLILQLLGLIVPWLSYHLPAEYFWLWFGKGLLAAAAFIAIYISAKMATKLGRWPLIFLASVIPVAITVNTFLDTMNGLNVNKVPYQKNLVAPAFNIRAKLTATELLQQADALYQEADAEAQKSMQ